nr:Rpn family recombination-promoting nuclease/putative transposase [Spirochaetota bacterium]
MEENIHNDFFINIIKNKKNAADFLSGVLPNEISSKIDFDYIDFDDTSYIQNRFKELFSDIVIRTKIENRYGDIYILIEHKSSLPESKALFLQILSYIYSMFEKDFNDKK